MFKTRVIIFGAGASYDMYLNNDTNQDHSYKPPLGDELFDTRFNHILENFKGASNIAGDLKHGGNLEKKLENIKQEAQKNASSHRTKQLISIKYYLQRLFEEISNNWFSPGTNYHKLVNCILDAKNNDSALHVICITFNYDRFLEKALEEAILKPIKALDEYISSPIPIIKLHGSSNWFRFVGKNLLTELPNKPIVEWEDSEHYVITKNNKDILQYIDQIPTSKMNPSEAIEIMENSYKIYNTDKLNQQKVVFPLIPAIAIPVTQKSKKDFECPNNHITLAESAVTHAERILIIGWKGKEDHLGEWISKIDVKSIQIMIVSNSKNGCEETMKQIQGYNTNLVDDNFIFDESGFSNFVVSDKLKNFLS